MKKAYILYLLLFSAAFASTLPEAKDGAEALLIRRILDFWRDKECQFAKTQIENYLDLYPTGVFTEHAHAILGDIALLDKAYMDALEHYNQISCEPLKSQAQAKRWQALYQLHLYKQLYQEIDPSQLAAGDIEGRFYFAEAAFREALSLMRTPEESEKAHALLREALPIYNTLHSEKNFGTHAKLAMAEIYRHLSQPETAAGLYLEIAEDASGQDEIRFHAAAMLTQCDKKKASSIFKTLASSSSNRASDAAYQWLLLLVAEGDWSTIESSRSIWLSKISKDHLSLAYFYLGMIAFEQKNYAQTLPDLEQALHFSLPSPYERTALEVLLTCAKERGNLDVSESCFETITKRYPDACAESALLRATTYIGAGKSKQGIVYLDEIIARYPSHVEKARIEKAKALIKEESWEEAHATVLEFIKLYTHSTRTAEMMRLAIHISCAQKKYDQLAQDLERAFAEQIFQEGERVEKLELLAKAYLKQDLVHAALGILHELPEGDPLLFTQCYIKEGHSHRKVILFGEKALERHPEQDRLHLHLFNSYLELSKEESDEELVKKAASHLDAAIDLYPVSLENRLWLTHYYVKTQASNALPLLESLLQTEANLHRFHEEAVMLARLYQKNGQSKLALPLVERIIAFDLATKGLAELIKAEIFEESGEEKKALALFLELETHPNSLIANESSLHAARLQFSSHPEESLKKLLHLKRCKNLANEPIHIEAALDHATLQACTLPKDKQGESILAALLAVKEEFTSESDISSKDYHESRMLMPEKERIYQAYMRYLNARIYQMQAKLAKHKQESRVKMSAAHALFSTLLNGQYAVSKYIVDHATMAMNE